MKLSVPWCIIAATLIVPACTTACNSNKANDSVVAGDRLQNSKAKFTDAQQVKRIDSILLSIHSDKKSRALADFAKTYESLFVSTNTPNVIICSLDDYDKLHLLNGTNNYTFTLNEYSESNLNFNAYYKGKEVGRFGYQSDYSDAPFCDLDVYEQNTISLLGGQNSFHFVSSEDGDSSNSIVAALRMNEGPSSTPQAINERGLILQQLGRHQQAIRVFKLAIERDSSLCESYLYRGNSYWLLGKYIFAKLDYQAFSDASTRERNKCTPPYYANNILNIIK